MRAFNLVTSLLQDLRYGARMLLRNPGFTTIAVLTLALGIGANSAIFSVVNAVLLRPLPYRDPDQIVAVSYYRVTRGLDGALGADFLEWRDQAKVFEQIAAYLFATTDLTGNGEPARLAAGYVSADLFSTLGVGPALGRGFTHAEDQPGGAPVVILSHSLWRSRFGGDPQVIGRTLTLSGQNRTVIGIMPPGFQFLREVDVWLPLALNVTQELSRARSHIVSVIARLRPGVSLEAAREDLTVILRRTQQSFPNWYTDVQVRVSRLSERLVGDVRLALLVLFGAVAFVLLIACSNVANLLLARATARQKEMAIRAAVGAGRLRLVRQLLTESLLLSLAGGAAGLLGAIGSVKLLVRTNPGGIARIEESGVDGYVLGFTCAVAALTGLIAGVLPALRASKTDVSETLKAQLTGRLAPGRGLRALPALMIAEIALALVLLVGAGLMTKSFLRLLAVPKGFNPDGVLTLALSPSFAKYPPESPQRRAYYQELLARIQSLPGIQSADLASFLPLAGPNLRLRFEIEGRPPFERGKEPFVEVNLISPTYFQTMGMQMHAGRPFAAQDGAEAPQVAIINETMARRFFPNENPIGRQLLLPNRTNSKSIVGVVGDTRHLGLDREANPEVYLPYLQYPNYVMSLVVRAASGKASQASLSSLAAAMRNQALAQEPNEPVNQITTMDQRLSDSVAPRRFYVILLAIFAAVALVIATVGIYGVISYGVGQRTLEIGIRMALGAEPRDVLGMVVRQGMRLTLIGVALGLIAALALTRVMQSLLFNVSATDPMTFMSITLLLIGVALIAGYLPARRVTKVDPQTALRRE